MLSSHLLCEVVWHDMIAWTVKSHVWSPFVFILRFTCKNKPVDRFKHQGANGHYSIPLNMTNRGLLLLNLILYMPYYNALLFASVEELDHKKPVAWKINLHFDNGWTVFIEETPHSYFISPFFFDFGAVCELSFNAFLSAVLVPNVLARQTSLSPECSKTHLCRSLIFPISFGLIRQSTATKAENQMPIRLEATCSLWYRWHLVVKAGNCSSTWTLNVGQLTSCPAT